SQLLRLEPTQALEQALREPVARRMEQLHVLLVRATPTEAQAALVRLVVLAGTAIARSHSTLGHHVVEQPQGGLGGAHRAPARCPSNSSRIASGTRPSTSPTLASQNPGTSSAPSTIEPSHLTPL